MTDLHKLKTSNNFIICDAGGGTVDLAVYKILGATTSLEIAEICARSGANCGSIFLDLRFHALLDKLLEGHPGHRDSASMTNFMNAFNDQKTSFRGKIDDSWCFFLSREQEKMLTIVAETMFYFTCFNVLPDDVRAIDYRFNVSFADIPFSHRWGSPTASSSFPETYFEERCSILLSIRSVLVSMTAISTGSETYVCRS
jgi:hypothetical protein